jgi:hypothetical protein
MGNVADGQIVSVVDFTADLFEPLIGQALVFGRPGEDEAPVRLNLLEVKRGKKSPAVRREPFSLFFVLKDQAPLGDGLHRLLQPGCEEADLLVSRVTAPRYEALDPTGMFYEAVFG